MFVTSGAQQHPMHQDLRCVIRRINNQTVWYLHSLDIEINEAVWTRKFQRAHQFESKEDATLFIRIFLGRQRSDECDTFSEYETWSI